MSVGGFDFGPVFTKHEHTKPVFGCDRCIAKASRDTAEERDKKRERAAELARQRTKDARDAIRRGQHPYTGKPLLMVKGATCGDCKHFRRTGYNRNYFKCFEPSMPEPTHGPATDIRKTWPACTLFALSTNKPLEGENP